MFPKNAGREVKRSVRQCEQERIEIAFGRLNGQVMQALSALQCVGASLYTLATERPLEPLLLPVGIRLQQSPFLPCACGLNCCPVSLTLSIFLPVGTVPDKPASL